MRESLGRQLIKPRKGADSNRGVRSAFRAEELVEFADSIDVDVVRDVLRGAGIKRGPIKVFGQIPDNQGLELELTAQKVRAVVLMFSRFGGPNRTLYRWLHSLVAEVLLPLNSRWRIARVHVVASKA